MSDPVWPHRWQPPRLPCPWDSPGKNTGVGCHFLFQCMEVKSESEVAQSCPRLSNHMDCMQPNRLLHSWDFPGKSTGVGCHCLLRVSIEVCPNKQIPFWKELALVWFSNHFQKKYFKDNLQQTIKNNKGQKHTRNHEICSRSNQ